MKPLTTEQMFHHDNHYDDENMFRGYGPLQRVKVR